LIGIRAEDALGKSLLEIFPDTPGLRRAEKVYRAVLRTQQSQTFVNDFDIDGRHYIFEIGVYPSRGGISVFARDITERKQAEEVLEQSRLIMEAVLESAPDGVYLLDLKGTFLYGNQKAEEIVGYSRNELIGNSFLNLNLLPEEHFEKAVELLECSHRGQPTGPDELQLIKKNGTRVWIEINTSVIRRGEEIQVIGFVRDITERKEIEEVLKQSEENYRALFDRSLIGTFVLDAATMKVVMSNQAAAKTFGFNSVEETIGVNPLDFVPPKNRGRAAGLIAKDLLSEDLRTTHEFQAVTKDGRTIWIIVTGARIVHEGRLAGLLSFTDITERKRAEEAIKQAAEEWRETFDSITDAISIQDRNHKVLRANKAFADIFHKKPRQILGKYCYELHKGNKPISGCPHKQTLATKQPAVAEFYESNLGKYLHESTSPIFDEQGEVVGAVHITRDITEQKQQNERLMMADRLASIGELAAGTAHEINNPLTSVIGFSQLLMERDIPDDIREDMNLIYSEAQRAAGVTRNLLAFARKHTPVKHVNQINTIIEDVLNLRAYEHKVNGVKVQKHLAPDLPEIRFDYFQMQQVFLNIIINAEYFMTEAHNRGTLTITTTKQNGTVRISIADDGPGIPPEDLRRIFDPFFTTKGASKGTGLGLSICHGIAAEHGGQIYATSQPGKGATILIELPISGGNDVEAIL
jgi:PAS domain S-box-containing protein